MNKESWYLDTCIVIALARNEQRQDSDEQKGLQKIQSALVSGQTSGTKLLASSITYYECAPRSKPDPLVRSEMAKVIEKWLDNLRSLVMTQNVTPDVASFARNLREKYEPIEKQLQVGEKMGFADWIHLATSALYRCDKLLTFDPRMLALGAHANFAEIVTISSPVSLCSPGPIFEI